MTMGFGPGLRPVIVPIAIVEALGQGVTCEACACRWSSRGSSFFCPDCGAPKAIFGQYVTEELEVVPPP